MTHKNYQFARARLGDLPLLRQWLAIPEVQKWWGNPKEQAAILQRDLRDSRMAMSMNIVSVNDEPFAYIQDYEVHAWPQPHLASLPAGTRAIDTFIGLQSHIGVGHGKSYLMLRAQQLLNDGARQIVVDPNINNARAIRAYEKAGFVQSSEEDTSEGPVVIMHFNPSMPANSGN